MLLSNGRTTTKPLPKHNGKVDTRARNMLSLHCFLAKVFYNNFISYRAGVDVRESGIGLKGKPVRIRHGPATVSEEFFPYRVRHCCQVNGKAAEKATRRKSGDLPALLRLFRSTTAGNEVTTKPTRIGRCTGAVQDRQQGWRSGVTAALVAQVNAGYTRLSNLNSHKHLPIREMLFLLLSQFLEKEIGMSRQFFE
ncbi:hypothetical protein ET33_14715 [Paenibacillus tyrfis]|uniref:Uncharacterized protein n=1 Tax=Paenibacillus tyrfis TaxID=1501230 RepID=A0A081NZ52_9BACL|nr:hypothetical protein ET33_14715 [Paenibacillus tyrfis]